MLQSIPCFNFRVSAFQKMAMVWSTIYKYSTNPEIFLDSRNIEGLKQRLLQLEEKQEQERDYFESVSLEISDWKSSQLAEFLELLGQSDQPDVAGKNLEKSLLAFSTPMASVLGSWLQGMSAPGVFESRQQLRVLAMLADDIGVGKPERSRYDEFKLLLKRFNLPELAVGQYELASTTAIDDDLFALPSILMAMSRRSDAFGPEICGIDLVFRSIGLLPCWQSVRSRYEQWIDWRRLDMAVPLNPSTVADPLDESMQIALHYCAQGTGYAGRVRSSVQWTLAALKQWHRLLLDRARQSSDAGQAMTRLIRNRAREASAYHQSFKLGGCPLSDRFKEALTEPAPLMEELARSRLIHPGDSSKSVLVNGLVKPRGKMFRIFKEDELAVIRKWIDSLPTQPEPAKQSAVPVLRLSQEKNDALAPPREGDRSMGTYPQSIRDAYHLLQGRALPPQTRDFAVSYVADWLDYAQHHGQEENAIPNRWPEAGLREWLSEQHDRHNEVFIENAQNQIGTREELVDSTLQLAPLICIDGSWLQGFTDMALASSPVGSALFEIYWDELGNGDIELNHPKIYRDLLREMGIELAPIGSREFAHDQRLRDQSFYLPVLWLSMGKLPYTFKPEILGMNLAMELSGVGDGYRLVSRALEHYRFSTLFVNLHNTIDNVASGHSAWAADSIDRHMKSLTGVIGADAFAAEWVRIRTGYKSLTSIPKRVSKLFSKKWIHPHPHDAHQLLHHV